MPRLSAKARTARENGKKSKGPVTAEGKQRVKFNAVTLGLTANRPVVLDDTEKGVFGEFLDEVLATGPPRDPAEAALVTRVAFAKLRVWRCQQAQAAALQDLKDVARDEMRVELIRNAVVLGRKLEFDPGSVVELPRGVPYTSLLAERDTDGPEWIRPQLEVTADGAEWLLGQFRSLEFSLAAAGDWDLYELRLALRLLGMRPENSHHEPGVAQVVVASHIASGRTCSLADYFQQVRYRSGGRPVRPEVAARQARYFPEDATAEDGRAFLSELIGGEIARLEKLIELKLAPQREAQLDRAESHARLDGSRRGDLIRRYENSASRELRKLQAELTELRSRPSEDDPADAFGAADDPELAAAIQFVSQDSPVGFVPREFDIDDPTQPPVASNWMMIEQVSFKRDRLRVAYDRLEDEFEARQDE